MDYELSDVGRDQARQLGAKLRGSSFAAAFTSDLCRASEVSSLLYSARVGLRSQGAYWT